MLLNMNPRYSLLLPIPGEEQLAFLAMINLSGDQTAKDLFAIYEVFSLLTIDFQAKCCKFLCIFWSSIDIVACVADRNLPVNNRW